MELSSQQQQQQLGYSSRHHEVGEGCSMMMSDDFREHMFDKVVTPSDVGKLNRLVIPKQYAEKYFPLDSSSNEKGLLLNFEDKGGKAWRFRYSYWNSSQSYVMTKGWSRFVKEKQLNAGDIVSFHRGTCSSSSLLEDYKYYIDWRRRMPPPPPPLAPPDQYYYPNHQTCSILQVQHGSAAAWFGTAGPPSFQHVLARPQYHLPLPNLHCFTRDHHPHLSQMQMMTATTTASALKTTASNFGDHNNMYVHHPIPIPIPTPSSSSSSSSYSGGATNRQYYDHHHASMSSTSTNPTSMVVHHGSVVYVRPIGGAQGSGMQTPQVQMPMRQDPVVGPHLEGNPMLFQSLPPPVVQCGNKAPKRLRLFGVNMDCPAAEGDADEDDDVDNHAPDFYAADHNIFPILSMPPNNMDDHHINSSPHIQSPCLYAGVYPPPTTNPNSPTTSIVNDSIFDKGNSSMS